MGLVNAQVSEVSPIRVLVARILTYRGRAETYASMPALFQGLCGFLRDAGTLAGVYPTLAAVKQRIQNQGAALDLDDVFAMVEAHNRAHPGDVLALGESRVVLSVPGTGERLAYHRELVHNLRLAQRPLLTLNAEALLEVLGVFLQPRLFAHSERLALLEVDFAAGERLGILRVLDTLYKATFSRTIRKELCEPTILFPLADGSFHLLVDHKKTAHLTLPMAGLLKPLLQRLYRTPDLAAVLNADPRASTRIQDGIRMLSGVLHDLASLPQKRHEIDAILRDHRPSDTETLEEL
jgi:hypothetical protein